MNIVLEFIFSIILIVEFMIGSLGNGFIVLVNCMDWVRRRKISSADQILTALAISRIVMLWSVFIYVSVTLLYSDLLNMSSMVRVVGFIWTLTNHFNLWFATSLSIFYFLKIANFSNSIFLYLKWRVKKVTSVTLLVSLLILFLNILTTQKYYGTWGDEYKGNMPLSSSLRNSTRFLKGLLITDCMFTLMPFTTSLMAFLLLSFSLWKHLKKMKITMKGPRDASTTAHMKALQTGITFLLLYAMFSVSLVIEMLGYDLLEEKLIISLDYATAISFPSIHSFILILGNRKLRQASLYVLWKLRGWSKHAEPSAC